MKLFFIAILLLSQTSCTSGLQHVTELNKVLDRSECKLKQLYSLEEFGSGGQLAGNIKTVYRCYSIRKGHFSIDEARLMIVTCLEEYYYRLNSESQLIKYFNEFPFQRKYINLGIIFCDCNDNPFNEGLARVGTGRNMIWYSTHNDKLGFVDWYEEPYEVAYEKVYGHKICD